MATTPRKRFDRKLYEENDLSAKDSLRKLLEGTEYKVVQNSKKTGVDVFIYKDGEHLFNIECEVKKVWKGPTFAYDTVQIPERKQKYTELEKPTVFIMFNADHSSYLTIKDTDLAASPKKEVPNKYVWKGELFFQVPIDKVKFNDIIGVIDEVLNAK